MNTDLVSVIIPTYNRFKFLLNAIKSVKEQTYKNIEIIVVNDCSTQEEYYNFDFKKEFGNNLLIINLEENSRKKYNIPSPAANARNIAIAQSNGTYLAFSDYDAVKQLRLVELPEYLVVDANYQVIQLNAIVSQHHNLFYSQLFGW